MKVYTTEIKEHDNWKIIENEIKKIKIKGIFVSFCDIFFTENKKIINNTWYGIIHNPIGWENFTPWGNKEIIFNNKYFLKSLKYCKIIYVLAKTQILPTKKFLSDKGFRNINVILLYHPLIKSNNNFNFEKYKQNKNKRIYSIGNWLRKQYTIFELKCNLKFEKVIIPFTRRTKLELEYYTIRDNIKLTNKELNSVKKIDFIPKYEYNRLFEDNLIFLDVYLTTINNTFLEAIISNTPIILNRKKEYIDIIGNKYPLFFDNINDINSFIEDDNNILNAHNYLKNVDKKKLGIKYFIEQIIKSI
tara:strand:+ start:76 stop:984 length:909 start_codon:yes stop_codon:yes gene_type:complete